VFWERTRAHLGTKVSASTRDDRRTRARCLAEERGRRVGQTGERISRSNGKKQKAFSCLEAVGKGREECSKRAMVRTLL